MCGFRQLDIYVSITRVINANEVQTSEEAKDEGSIETSQLRWFLDNLVTVASINHPSRSLHLKGPFLAFSNDKNPDTSGMPKSKMYPWSSTLLTAAVKVYQKIGSE